jgi:hypothetical protein
MDLTIIINITVMLINNQQLSYEFHFTYLGQIYNEQSFNQVIGTIFMKLLAYLWIRVQTLESTQNYQKLSHWF